MNRLMRMQRFCTFTDGTDSYKECDETILPKRPLIECENDDGEDNKIWTEEEYQIEKERLDLELENIQLKNLIARLNIQY